jgi:hypothetical protein
MARASRSDNPIEKLLNDRNQYLSWLARLDTSGDAVSTVPEGVRHKIRGDYEARLKNVVDELRHHSTAIDEQLEEYRARKYELTNREAQAKELMSEAEVRHAVGEYDEVKYQTLRAETTRVLVTVREELSKTNAEIDRLTEVQTLIAAPLPAAPAPTPPAAPSPAPRTSGGQKSPDMAFLQLEPDFSVPSAAPAGPPPIVPPEPSAPSKLPLTAKGAPPKPAPKGKDEPPARTLWYPSGKEGAGAGAGAGSGGGAPAGSGQKMDELAFLKSVTNEPPPSRRASGGYKIAPPETPHAAAPPPPPAPPHPPSAPVITTADPFASKAPPADAKRGSNANVPKTLKCGECGTLNRPTEWYCERCGAELAAL